MANRLASLALAAALTTSGALSQDAPTPSPVPAGTTEQTITFEAPPVSVFRGAPVSLQATASSGLPVRFTATGDCAVVGSRLQPRGAGKCWVTAHQDGDATYSAAPDVDRRIDIAKARQTISFPAERRHVFGERDFLLRVAASSGLGVMLDAEGACSVSGLQVHLLGAGTCTLIAHQVGNDDFEAAPIVERPLAIDRGKQTITFLPIARVRGVPLRLRATASSGLPVTLQTAGSCSISGGFLSYIGGACKVTATQPGDANFLPATPVSQSLWLPLGR